jgi:putative nucleotidyltransferase with HDIG domain
MKLFRSMFAWMLLASVAPVAVFAGLVLAALAGSASAPPLAPLLRAGGVAALLSFALAALLAAHQARRVAIPVRRCVAGALEIARGRFGSQVTGVPPRSEVADLAYTFNYMSRELAAYDGENRRLIGELEAGWLATIRSLASAIDAKDPHTRGHSGRVSELSVEVARELGLEGKTLDTVAWGGLLHDIGKIGVPEPVLGKRDSLTPDEQAVMRAHPTTGAEILRGVSFLDEAAKAVRHHHERWDGNGYPDALAGEEIPLVARIVGAADTFDACTSERPYQPAMPISQALAILARLRGAQLDPAVHDALVRVIRRRVEARPAAAAAAG